MFIALTVLAAFGEDWMTTDGKTYKGVTVIKVEADAVTILYSDGGALVPLQTLPPNLQKRFNYNPAKAQAAAQARKAENIESAKAMEQEAQQKEEQNAKAEAEAATESEQHKPHETSELAGTIFQKIPNGGLLIMCELGGAPRDANINEGLVLLKGMPNEADLVDNQGIGEIVYRSGSYTYTSTQGVQKTVAAYTAVGPSQARVY